MAFLTSSRSGSRLLIFCWRVLIGCNVQQTGPSRNAGPIMAASKKIPDQFFLAVGNRCKVQVTTENMDGSSGRDPDTDFDFPPGCNVQSCRRSIRQIPWFRTNHPVRHPPAQHGPFSGCGISMSLTVASDKLSEPMATTGECC
ncbi:MAG: hypothetical protein JNM42_11380 [Propionivibrio sp.]|uniref:hypothetical protein n=1 Tax=Propionivibrio sp. TaxID=2212460 RepID=UPI001A5F32FA|nr:hypothetical protein [Propionivibrio sp.]MBL8415030.1 hypothetical protein [Propionivibrio sp.]